MKIVVTGASGFVGYHVARLLAEEKRGDVSCLVRATSDCRFVQKLPVRCVTGDLRDPSSLESALDGCQALFHVAADYRLWARRPSELVDSNVQGMENILRAAERKKVRRVVVTSSVSAVGRPELHAAGAAPGADRASWEARYSGNEAMDPAPSQLIGPYKQSKYQGELVARRFSQGMDLVIVNPSTPVGTHDIKPTPTGKMIVDFMNRRMPAYLETGLNLVDVEDVARGHLLAWDRGRRGERYILGNRNLTLQEILQILSGLTGLPAPRVKIPYWVAYAAGFFSTGWAQVTGRPPGVPLDGVKMAREMMFYDCAKARRELGFQPRPVGEALRKAVEFFRENGFVRGRGPAAGKA